MTGEGTKEDDKEKDASDRTDRENLAASTLRQQVTAWATAMDLCGRQRQKADCPALRPVGDNVDKIVEVTTSTRSSTRHGSTRGDRRSEGGRQGEGDASDTTTSPPPPKVPPSLFPIFSRKTKGESRQYKQVQQRVSYLNFYFR